MKAGRNDPCPCGSGRRYRQCCGALASRAPEVAALLDAAQALRTQGRAREAVPLYQRALAIDPRSAAAHNDLGNAFIELGQPADAVGCYRAALGLLPAAPEVHCNLGDAQRQAGQFNDARTSAERALALDPRSSFAHNLLGLALTGLGQRREAVPSYRRALELNPRYIEALNNLGDVLRDLGERREAAVRYRQATELDPLRPESHYNLGSVLFELRRVGEAVASLNRALSLRKNYPQALVTLAAALRMQARADEALASCEAALALEPGNVEALALLGELRADRGHFAEAQELFQRALGRDPAFVSAYCSIAAHRTMSGTDGAWLEGVRQCLARPLPLGHEINLHYALGKYCDDLRQYDQAFGHYRQANQLTKRYGASYDRSKLGARIERLRGTFSAASVRELQAHGSDSELPVFIIGMPRSGTSLTEQILASHPAVFGAGEIRFWEDAFASLESAAGGESGTGGGDVAPGGSDGVARLIPGQVSAYLERLGRSSGDARRVIDKMPANFLYVGMIHAAFPRACFIHMQRHPLDTCLSIYFQNFFSMGPYSNDLENLAHYYGEYLRIMDHWRAVLPPGALLEVPYEALIADQEAWTRRMLEFVGLPWDASCLDFHQTERVVITASRWQVRQRITTTSSGRWRNYEKYLGPLRHLAQPAEADALDQPGGAGGRGTATPVASA
jgi:tetratricopeptide (TPR) repeat protein